MVMCQHRLQLGQDIAHDELHEYKDHLTVIQQKDQDSATGTLTHHQSKCPPHVDMQRRPVYNIMPSTLVMMPFVQPSESPHHHMSSIFSMSAHACQLQASRLTPLVLAGRTNKALIRTEPSVLLLQRRALQRCGQ